VPSAPIAADETSKPADGAVASTGAGSDGGVDGSPADPYGFTRDGRLLITNLGSSQLWTLDPAHLRRVACRAAGRDITREEWADLLPGRPYRPVCG